MTMGSELESSTLAEDHKVEYEQFGTKVSKIFILSVIIVVSVKSLNHCSLVPAPRCVYKSDSTKRTLKEQVRDGRFK
jgi:hypothetical protein